MRRSGPVKIYAQNCSQAPAECKRQTSPRIKGRHPKASCCSEPHPVKRTEKNYIIFPTDSLGCQSLFCIKKTTGNAGGSKKL